MTARWEVLPDPDALARRVADWLLDAATTTDGPFAIALSGGSTPRLLYAHLASQKYRDRFPWARVHWFWGDERFVPHDDPMSNYRMVQEALLAHSPAPPANIHPIPTEGIDPDTAAWTYERELKAFHGTDRLDPARPLFDVTLLGLGEDGHTASLFPGSVMLGERERWVAPVIGVKAEARITLTYPALESSRRVAFLAAGPDKRAVVSAIREGHGALPAALLRPVGELTWFLDQAAAGDVP
jgi:6-phosphogluconolactonase